ncbi:immunoglobulin-like domain-containing protein, partial [Clostridium novyi]
REEALKRQQEQEKQRIKDENNRLIEEAKNNLNLGDLANVKANLTLSTEDSNGVKISWKSNDEATIKSDGTVTRPSADSEDKNVKLVATFTKGEEVSTKEFEAIVKAQEKPKVKTEEEIVELLKEDKPIEFKKPENFDIAIKESLNQLKPSFEAVVPYSEYNKYNFNNYNNIMVQLGGNDYGKPGVQTSGGTVIDGKVKMTVKFNYRRDIDEVKRQKKATEEVVKKIVKEVIKPGMSDVEKELALHDYVVKHADYNMAGLNKNPADLEDHSAYGVLVLGKGVCESYAKAMHLLLNEVGIECKYATGYKRNPNGGKGGGHAWNMVKLDNEWYNLDATWDDPVSDRVGRSDNEAIVSSVIHTYFNVPDSVFNKDHIRGDFEQNNYPVANGTKYSYDNLDVDEFMNDGTKVPKVTSRDELIRVFKEVMKNRKTEVYVRFKGFSMTQQDLMNMLGKILDGNIYSSYGVNPTDSSHAYCVFKLR